MNYNMNWALWPRWTKFVNCIVFLCNMSLIYYMGLYTYKYNFIKEMFAWEYQFISDIFIILLIICVILCISKWVYWKNRNYFLSKPHEKAIFYRDLNTHLMVAQTIVFFFSCYWLYQVGAISIKLFLVENNYISLEESCNFLQDYQLERIYTFEEKKQCFLDTLQMSIKEHNKNFPNNTLKFYYTKNDIDYIAQFKTLKEIELHAQSLMTAYIDSKRILSWGEWASSWSTWVYERNSTFLGFGLLICFAIKFSI